MQVGCLEYVCQMVDDQYGSQVVKLGVSYEECFVLGDWY